MTASAGDSFLASDAAKIISGECLRDGKFSSLGYSNQTGRRMLSFLDHENYLPAILGNSALSGVIVSEDLAGRIPAALFLLESARPKDAFYDLHSHLANNTVFYGSAPPSEISPSARIHPSAVVSAEGVSIGANVVIDANVTINTGTVIDADCIIRSGTTLGGEGFLFQRRPHGIIGIPHAGGVHLKSGVEVQHNCCIDKAIFGRHTTIGEGTKLDNFVHVAHDATLGDRCLIAASATIAGSVVVGNDVWIGPSATISNFVHIGDGAFVAIGTVVTRNVLDGQRVLGRALGFTVSAGQ